MECADVRDALAKGEHPQSPELDAHLRDCEACAGLFAHGERLGLELGSLSAASGGAGSGLGPELSRLFDAVQDNVARERGPAAWLRSRPTPLRIALAIGFAGAIAASMLIFKRRPDLDLYPLARLGAAVGAYALLVGSATRIALRPLQLGALPTAFRIGVIVSAVVIPFAIAAAPAAHFAHPASLAGAGSDLPARAAECFVFGSVLAIPALLLLWALDRGAHRGLYAAVASAGAAGLIGILAVELHCPITHPAHLVAGHATVGAVLVLAYALVTWMRRRASESRGSVASSAG